MLNTAIRETHPRPDFIRPVYILLDGEWQFSFDDGDAGKKENWQNPCVSFDRRILVPYCYQCKQSGIHDQTYHPILWYRRSFSLPDTMNGSRVLLRFGAVDYSCEVFVNGKSAGTHEGGYTPFHFDITDCLKADENDICLRVEDRRNLTQPRGKQYWEDQWFACWYIESSGIWQSVYLEAAGALRVESARITPDIDTGTAAISLTLNSYPDTPIGLSIQVYHNGILYRSATSTLTQCTQRIIIDMISERTPRGQGFRPWTPETPELYDVEIELDSGDFVSTYFGMRKIDIRNGYVLLNNRLLYQRLVLDQGYWPDTLITPPNGDALRADVEWAKRLGYNGARKHQKLEDPRYYYWADKLGLLVWEEIPSAYDFTDKTVMNLAQTLAGAIERDYNHPCIIVYVPLNESWGVPRIFMDQHMLATANMLYEQAKALDGTRLVSTNDGWENARTDLFALHDYAATGDILRKHFEDRKTVEKGANSWRMSVADGVTLSGSEPFLLTEYGGIAFAEKGKTDAWGYHDKVKDEEAFFERYQSLTDAARSIPYCQGYVYTQLTDVQQEVNGVLTADRVPKVDVERFRSMTINPEGRYH